MATDPSPHREPILPPTGRTASGKLCPRLILEGTRLTGKTELAYELLADPRFIGPRKYRYHTPLVSAEWGGLTDTPWGESLLNFSAEHEDRALGAWQAWLTLFESLRYEAFVVDRFHLSLQAEQRRDRGGAVRWSERLAELYDEMDQRLADAGFGLVLSVRDESTFEAARAARLKVSGNPRQYDDLSIFIEEQRLLRELAERSRLPVLEVNADDQSVAIDAIADWLGLADSK